MAEKKSIWKPVSHTVSRRKRNVQGHIINTMIQMPSNVDSDESKDRSKNSNENKRHWNISEILSAIAPLIITALLYLIGWAYISSWYSYFGVSITQINIPIPLVLTQSTSPIWTAVFMVALSVFLYSSLNYFSAQLDTLIIYVIPWITFYYEIALMSLARSRFPIPYKSTRRSHTIQRFTFQHKIIKNAWQINITAILGLTMWASLVNPFRSAPELVSRIFSPIPGIVIATIFAFFTALSSVSWFLKYVGWLPKPESYQHTPESFSSFVETKRKWVVTFCVLYFFLILIMARGVAFSDAAAGKKGIVFEENIQDIFITGPKMLGIVPSAELLCDEEQKTCIYGPFGLIAENDKSFFLVRWNVNPNQTPEFPQDSGLYIIPRSDQTGAYFLLPDIATPYPTSAITPQFTPTATSRASSTPTVVLTDTKTPSPTFMVTPTPSQR
jgi:hypothetical protein